MPNDVTTVLDPAQTSATGNGHRPPRPLHRRSSLPSGRAVVGGLLITLAVLATFLAYRGADRAPTTAYATTDRALNAGERITPDALRFEPLDLPDTLGAQAFADGAGLEGAVALAPLRAGELLQRSDLLLANAEETPDPSPTQEFSFSLPRDHAVSGRLNRGERVDLLATYGSGDQAQTWVVVRDAVIIDIDNAAESTLGGGADTTVTLALGAEDDILRATHATDVATVTLVRATRDAGLEPGPDHYSGPAGPATETAGAESDDG